MPIRPRQARARRRALDLQEGREPKNVVRDPAKNQFRIVSASQAVSTSTNWKEYAKQLEADTTVRYFCASAPEKGAELE